MKSAYERRYASIWLLFKQFRKRMAWQQSSKCAQAELQPPSTATSFWLFFFAKIRQQKVFAQFEHLKDLLQQASDALSFKRT